MVLRKFDQPRLNESTLSFMVLRYTCLVSLMWPSSGGQRRDNEYTAFVRMRDEHRVLWLRNFLAKHYYV
jgi:hypothetical protein